MIELDASELREIYDKLERQVLILMAIPIPFFALVYLYQESGSRSWDLPQFSSFWESFGLSLIGLLLALHYFNFHQKIKTAIDNPALVTKLRLYGSATVTRFWMLFLCAILCAIGLLLFSNAGYTIAFAVTLVFFSLGKPTPDRIVRLLKLKGAEREEVEKLKVRQQLQ